MWSWHPVQLSLFVATIAAAITFILAICAAYGMIRKKRRGKALVETLFFMPLVLPPSVIGFLLLIVFGNQGPFGKLLEWLGSDGIVFTPTAAIVAAGVVAFPLMYQSLKTGFQSVDSNILGAAKVDGASEWTLLTHIIIPMSSRSLLTALILGFTRGFGEFGATLMFAGNIPGKTQTIPTAIYFAIESGQNQLAWSYVWISIGFSFLLLLLANRVKA
ncbi:molybdate ABC transporter permease subunit [Virgibacillus sp. MSP4-1]|uniref:molybdate ABC transporter permease subunit n=1 Tax=Virgibacillus sp. MSP4-1 TaxID=2700081 RepID=UPI00039FFD20|nr:molybdate ABC transporter permease subunit [Virgibacillus sp. MSP4-1]QHS21844.1 molybdate ABC transporter permease subunit [Virgibacillus sp. MSP4-1]